MIVPNRHVDDIERLRPEEFQDITRHLVRVKKLLRAKLGPSGFNIGINLGKAGGAGIAHHLHIHIIPRWFGDYNFMPVIGETKIIPEALTELYQRLKSDDQKTSGRKRK